MNDPLVLRTTCIAERTHDSYSSLIVSGLTGCSLAQIFNLEKTRYLLPSTA